MHRQKCENQSSLAVLAVSCYFSLYAYPNFSSKVACRHESGTDLRMQLLVKKSLFLNYFWWECCNVVTPV